MKNSEKFWAVIGVISLILIDIFLVPNMSYYFTLKASNPVLKTGWDVFILICKETLACISLFIQVIFGGFLIYRGIQSFNRWVDNLKFEKKPKPKKVEFKTIEEFKSK